MNRPPKLNEDVAERRRREDESPRLRAVVPRLKTLRLELSESRGEETQVENTQIKRIAIEHAPSVFMIPCGERRCKHGSYDLTSTILAGLRRGETQIECSDTCYGEVGTARCGRIMKCVAFAEYTEEAPH